eukprot:6188791-Pleurochrysis_carterae.AAC.1
MAPRDRNKTPPVRPRVRKATGAGEALLQEGIRGDRSSGQQAIANSLNKLPAVAATEVGHGACATTTPSSDAPASAAIRTSLNTPGAA